MKMPPTGISLAEAAPGSAARIDTPAVRAARVKSSAVTAAATAALAPTRSSERTLASSSRARKVAGTVVVGTVVVGTVATDIGHPPVVVSRCGVAAGKTTGEERTHRCVAETSLYAAPDVASVAAPVVAPDASAQPSGRQSSNGSSGSSSTTGTWPNRRRSPARVWREHGRTTTRSGSRQRLASSTVQPGPSARASVT